MTDQNAGQPPLVNDQQINQGIQYVKRNAVTIDQTDRRVWELVSDVPEMEKKYAYGCAILNVLISGSGTLASAFLGGEHLNKTQVVMAFIQFMTSIYLIGYLFSLYWAYKFIMISGRSNAQNLPPKNDYNPYG